MNVKWLCWFVLFYAANFYAGVQKCTDTNGHVMYSDTACHDNSNRQTMKLSPSAETKTESSIISNLSENAKVFLRRLTHDQSVETQAEPAEAASQLSRFHCDGRTYCSQMTSCEEATFFINNCPNTKMDGNRDGVPCEKQWCR